MNIWETLGIKPTRDDSAIRRAYAKQLKIHRPDSDPAAYQKLREAFDAAKAYASWEFDDEDGNDSDIDEDWSDEVEPENHENDVFYVNPSDIITTEWDNSANEILVDEFNQQSKDTQDAQKFELEDLAEPENLYTEQEIHESAYQFVFTGNMRGFKEIWLKVSAEGSLRQQQQFHQYVAVALSEELGLKEYHVEQASRFFDWGLDEYDTSHTIPISIQYAIEQQLIQTKVSYVLKQLDEERKRVDFLDAAGIRLLKSKCHIPLWMRLVPGMLPELSRKANELITFYPELELHLNPEVLKFLQKPRIEPDLQGISLFIFWVSIFSAEALLLGNHISASITALAIVIFYLYLTNLIENSLKGYPKLLTYFLGVEYIFSLVVLLLLVGGLLFCIVNAMLFNIITPMNDSDALLGLLFGILSIVILCFLLRKAWPEDESLSRKPSKMLRWIVSSPWKVAHSDTFDLTKAILIFYIILIFFAINNLLTLFS